MGLNLLQRKIKEASQKYYTEGDSGVSDKQFDEMLDALKKEDPTNPLVTDVGHGYKVDEDTTPGEKVKHRYGVAGSLDKCHDWKEFEPGVEPSRDVSHRYASLKLDGLSIVMYYENGQMTRALTRGDGTTGITITDKVLFIHPEYKNVHPEFTGAVRGEAVMSHENFEKFKALHPEAKNARNSTAGLINGKGIVDDLKFVEIVVYRVVGMTTKTDKPMCTYTHVQQFLRENFSRVAPWEWVELSEGNFMEAMELLREKWYSIYPADGIVLSSPGVSLRHTGNGYDIEAIYPSIAFKFKAESAVTRVIGVEWNLSKTRYLIPRIQLETVQLSGTSVSWCAGNNADNIENLKIGPGAEVEVLKSGEIIPYLEQVITPSTDVAIPTHCPECGTELERCGVHLMCPNRACANAEVQDLLVWMENIAPYDGLGDTLKLKFLNEMFNGEPTIEKIYEKGNPIYSDPTPGAQIQMFREMYSQLFTNKIKLCNAIRALNIPRFGEVTSRKLAQYPEQVMTLVYAAEHPRIYIHPDGFEQKIGDANYKSMMDNLWKFKRFVFIKNNIDWTGEPKDESAVKVAITGKLSVKRSAFEQELRDAGYAPGSISKDTCFLITDNPNSTSDKNKRADEWGIEKITEADFRQKYLMNR